MAEPVACLVSPPPVRYPPDGRAVGDGLQPVRCTRFFKLYQIHVGHADNDAGDEDLSQDKKGVKGRMEGSHSPFGLIYQIAKDTGWSVREILDLPYATLVMMLSDTPRYVAESGEKAVRISSMEQLLGMVGQTNKHNPYNQ